GCATVSVAERVCGQYVEMQAERPRTTGPVATSHQIVTECNPHQFGDLVGFGVAETVGDPQVTRSVLSAADCTVMYLSDPVLSQGVGECDAPVECVPVAIGLVVEAVAEELAPASAGPPYRSGSVAVENRRGRDDLVVKATQAGERLAWASVRVLGNSACRHRRCGAGHEFGCASSPSQQFPSRPMIKMRPVSSPSAREPMASVTRPTGLSRGKEVGATAFTRTPNASSSPA